MSTNKVHSLQQAVHVNDTPSSQFRRFFTPQWMLLGAWFVVGVIPLLLQTRSYLKFVTPHKIAERLVVAPNSPMLTANLTELCPVRGHVISFVWWNTEPTHYYNTDYGRICHFVTPQYNVHGNYFISDSRMQRPFPTTPTSCANHSFYYEEYYYHGSIGYFSFYEDLKGTYCAKDNYAYMEALSFGTFDMNGSELAADTGSTEYRRSYWYGTIGAVWIVYRVLLLRRSFVTCKRYGRKCEQMGERLRRKEAVVFVQESLRLSAHGARNYHRVVLLSLLLEGIMTDLFLVAGNNGLGTKLQYVSLGYNLSGLLLLLFEIIENMNYLHEKRRLLVKRLLFTYETFLVGEIVCSAALQYFLTSINRSSLRRSRPTALAVSYYVWGLVGHVIAVLFIFACIMSIRVLWAMVYVRWKHHSLAIFTESCCVDSMIGVRNRMTMLGGYNLESGRLYYRAQTLKAFGLLRMIEEDGTELIVQHKLHWFAAAKKGVVVIGVVAGRGVEPCAERTCTGVTSFFDRSLGGPATQDQRPCSLCTWRHVKVSTYTSTDKRNQSNQGLIAGNE